MPMLSTGLTRHPKFGTYYLRRRIPNDLLPSYAGKKEKVVSLRTKDYRTAVDLHRKAEAALTEEWEGHRQKLADEAVQRQARAITYIDALTPEAIEGICLHAEAASLACDESRREDGNYTPEEVEEYQAGYPEAIEALGKAVGRGNCEILLHLVQDFLSLYGYRVKGSDAEMRRLALAYGRAMMRTNQKLLRRFEGHEEPTPVLAQRLSTPMLSEVVRAYTEYYEKKGRAAMLKKIKSVMPLLLSIVGDKPIGALRQSDFITFFETVQKLPPRWKDLCRQQNISVVELSKRPGNKEMSKGTFDGTYLAALGPFMPYCRLYCSERGWPKDLTIEGVEYTGSRKESEFGQRHFEPSELRRLFQGPEMAAIAQDPSQAHKYWLPHLGLFTGARVNELCQLNPQVDIRQDPESRIWFLDITDKTESHAEVEKSVKTAGSKRKVPIHPQLLELGFLQYVERVKMAGHTLLFPDFPPSVGRASPKAGEWFIDFLRKLELRDETPGARLVGMHAFRSTLLRQAMLLELVNIEVITGHSGKVTGLAQSQDGQMAQTTSAVVKTYQGELPVNMKLDILKRVAFKGLTFFKPKCPVAR